MEWPARCRGSGDRGKGQGGGGGGGASTGALGREVTQVGPGPGLPLRALGALCGAGQKNIRPLPGSGALAGGSLGRQQAMPRAREESAPPYAVLALRADEVPRGTTATACGRPLPMGPGQGRHGIRRSCRELPLRLQGSRLVGGNYTLYCAPGFEASRDAFFSAEAAAFLFFFLPPGLGAQRRRAFRLFAAAACRALTL